MNARRWAFALAPVAAAAGFGALGARQAPQIYARLDKPVWAPPPAAFGPVWSSLYAAAALAGARMPGRASRGTMALHLTQLTLNAAWPAAFFGARSKRAALLIILALALTIAVGDPAGTRREVAQVRGADLVQPRLLCQRAAPCQV